MDVHTIRAFLDGSHLALADDLSGFCQAAFGDRPPPHDDASARNQAREALTVIGSAGYFRSIASQDLRACALSREALAAVSPLADAVFALQALGATPIVIAGSQTQRTRWLDAMIAGRAMAAFAMTEAEAGSDVGAMTTTATPDGDAYVLDGSKTLISNAGIADVYTVFASSDPSQGRKAISCFLVSADSPGFHFVAPQVLSAPHPLGDIAFDGCRVPRDALLGEEGGGFALGMETLDRLRATVAAAACGMAARALAEATHHAVHREQFGQPLAEFQLIQDKLARMAIDLDAARLLTYRAAWEKDGGGKRVTRESAMAKAFATEAAQRIIDAAVQIVGGRGVLADHPVDHLYRAIRALRIYEGTTEIQHLVIAGQMLRRTP